MVNAVNLPTHLLPQAFLNQQNDRNYKAIPNQQQHQQQHQSQQQQQQPLYHTLNPSAQYSQQSLNNQSIHSNTYIQPESPSHNQPFLMNQQQNQPFSHPNYQSQNPIQQQQPYNFQFEQYQNRNNRQHSLGYFNDSHQHYQSTTTNGDYSSKNRSASSLTYGNSMQPQPFENRPQQLTHNKSPPILPYHNQPTQPPPQPQPQPLPQPPYPVSNNPIPNFQPQQSQSSIPQQPRRQVRKAPSSNLPPIMNDQVLYNNQESRRIVSQPSQSQPNYISNDSRTKSLSSTSMKNKIQEANNINNNKNSNSSQNSSTSLHHTFSLSSKSRSFTSISKLSSLSTKKFGSSSSISNNKVEKSNTHSSSKTLTPSFQHKSSIYPAILSEVAKLFKEVIILTINTKDGLEYHDTFTGKMAVDILCRIIRTNDRNLALLLGRSLDAQKFFHDVTYNHRLRDSAHEVYAFNHVYNDVDFFDQDGNHSNSNSALNSKHGSFVDSNQLHDHFLTQQLPQQVDQPSSAEYQNQNSTSIGNKTINAKELSASQQTGVNGVFTILTDCYSPTCSRNKLCYSIACPRRLEQQARLNLKPQGGLKRAVSKLSLHDQQEENETLWHKTVPQSVLDKLDKHEKTRQELIYEFIYTERDYVKDLEFMSDFYIMPLKNPANNIIPEYQRESFIYAVFGGVNELLKLARQLSEALIKRQQQQKPVVETIGDVFLDYIGQFEPFIKYSGNKVFASFEHERQQSVNMKYARFLDAIEKKPESRRQDLSSFLIKGVQRPARYQLLLAGILKHTKPESPDYKFLVKAKEEIEKLLVKINIQTGISTDRHKIMVLHRLLGKETLENKFNFKLSYNHRIIYQVTLSRKRDNEKIELYLFEHALLLVKSKVQNKREQHKVFERPIYLPLLFVNSGIEIPTTRTILHHRFNSSLISDTGIRNQRQESNNYIGQTLNSSSSSKFQINIFGLGSNQVHTSLFAEDLTIQNQVLQQINQQQKKLITDNDFFTLCKFETRRFTGNNKINCGVPCYGGKKLLYGTDSGVWVSTVRSISTTSNEKIVSDPTLVISKPYITQIEVLVEYSKLLVLSDKNLYEYELSCTDSLDHVKNTKSGKIIMQHISFFKIGVCDGKLLICGAKTGSSQHSICIFEPVNPFEKNSNKNFQKSKSSKVEIQEIPFSSDPISISFLKSKLCIGCTKGFEIFSLQNGNKEPILDEADPSLDFAIQKESVTPLSIHKLGRNFLLSYSEFVFLINKNGWRTNHEWGIFWEGNPQNIALFFPYILSFEPSFIEIRDLHSTNLLRSLIGENIRFLHSNEHEAMFACEENGYDIILSIDFLNLKPKLEEVK
ncbi:unnamed protein product [Candida verbasci]|uniref:Uncharacterized protein n=1 Tax=Candida verbasci TaxID=1227364 RepID=A0A9W4TTD9_9ASCO|nr:unnamed protein product [Candida verbasci]